MYVMFQQMLRHFNKIVGDRGPVSISQHIFVMSYAELVYDINQPLT